MVKLFADGFALRGIESDEKNGTIRTNVSRLVPHVRGNRNRIAGTHLDGRTVRASMLDVTVEYDEYLLAIRMIMARIGHTRVENAAAQREIGGITERSAGPPSQLAPFEWDTIARGVREKFDCLVHG